MSELHAFIDAHTALVDPASTAAAEATDMIFMLVGAKGQRNEDRLRELIVGHKGDYIDKLDDHKEHSYLEVGAWLGSQDYALRFMALGSMWGMWQLLTPRTVMGSLLDDETIKMMAGQGYISIIVPEAAEAA